MLGLISPISGATWLSCRTQVSLITLRALPGYQGIGDIRFSSSVCVCLSIHHKPLWKDQLVSDMYKMIVELVFQVPGAVGSTCDSGRDVAITRGYCERSC